MSTYSAAKAAIEKLQYGSTTRNQLIAKLNGTKNGIDSCPAADPTSGIPGVDGASYYNGFISLANTCYTESQKTSVALERAVMNYMLACHTWWTYSKMSPKPNGWPIPEPPALGGNVGGNYGGLGTALAGRGSGYYFLGCPQVGATPDAPTQDIGALFQQDITDYASKTHQVDIQDIQDLADEYAKYNLKIGLGFMFTEQVVSMSGTKSEAAYFVYTTKKLKTFIQSRGLDIPIY